MLNNCLVSDEQFGQAETLAINAVLGTGRGASVVGIASLNEERITECKAYSEMATVMLLVLGDEVLDAELTEEQKICFAEITVSMLLFKARLPQPART